jgi:redox-sensitive bicupin YhaK (pirin superfamily)
LGFAGSIIIQVFRDNWLPHKGHGWERSQGGFQLWANLPASHKMMHPRYREVKSDEIPLISRGNGVTVRIICGKVDGEQGPVQDIVTDPEYLDIRVSAKTEFIHPTKSWHTVFAYIIEGKASFCQEKNPYAYEVEGINYFDFERDPLTANETLVLFDEGEQIIVLTEDEPVRFLLISGKPINEPVAWYGPIVMNSQQELEIAFEEYRNGTFIKHQKG